MIKNSFLVGVIQIFLLTQINAQQTKNWYFGQNSGLVFSGSSSTILTNSSMSTDEGVASISDFNGNLLFYTDGIDIWNGNHQLQTVGTSSKLKGHTSSTHSAVIVPKPGSTSNYFIFTADAQPQVPQIHTYGIHYNEVSVISGTVTQLFSPVQLLSHSMATERLAVVCNGSEYWVVTVTKEGEFLSYRVNTSGVNTIPVQSTAAFASYNTNDQDEWVGQLKVSPDGTKLALARRHITSPNEVFDFDITSGRVTSLIGAYFNGTGYGIEFSPNSQYLYYSTGFQDVYQLDINSFVSNLVFQNPSTAYIQRLGSMQLAPDGKIYIANGYQTATSPYLDVLDMPNASPVYHNDLISYPTNYGSRMGLPTFPNCALQDDNSCLISAGFQISQDYCTINFSNISFWNSSTYLLSYHWDFGDGYTSSDANPSHLYSSPGMKRVCLTAYGYDGNECCEDKYCLDIEISENPGCISTPCSANLTISYSPTFGPPGTCPVNLSGAASSVSGTILSWNWTFGDGSSGSGQTVNHQYSGQGPYSVNLTVFMLDPDGKCCSISTNGWVSPCDGPGEDH